MSRIKFVQLDGTVRLGTPSFLATIKRAQIPYATSFSYYSNECAEPGQIVPPYGLHEAVTIVMVDEAALKHMAMGYSQVKGKTIILLTSTKPQREFNFGMAVGIAPLLPSGVYIANKGKVTEWSEYYSN